MIGTLVALAMMTAMAIRVTSESRSELAIANVYEQDGDSIRAIEHYRRAMRWSFPLSPYSARAAASLRALAGQLEDEGRMDDALLAWRSIAGSAAATRFLYSPENSVREEAHDEVARLIATDRPPGIDVGADAEERAAEHRGLLGQSASPDPFWGTLLLLGFGAWLGGLAVVASRGFYANGRLRWAMARGPLSGALAGLVAFVMGMLFA